MEGLLNSAESVVNSKRRKSAARGGAARPAAGA